MHHIMTCEAMYPPTTLSAMPDFPQGPWFTGQPITSPIPVPLEYTIDPTRPGLPMPFYRCAYPLMRADLLAALEQAGVDNLQRFPAVVSDPQRGTVYTDYSAINVIGVAAVADLARSARAGIRDGALLAVDFTGLVIDPSAAQELLLFRLAEDVSAIVVHERVRRTVESRGVPGMLFYEQGEWGIM
jgi:hypothetical protein